MSQTLVLFEGTLQILCDISIGQILICDAFVLYRKIWEFRTYFYLVSGVHMHALDIKLLYPWAQGASRCEKLLPPSNVTGPNIVNKICCYQGAHRFRRPSFDRSDMKISWSSYVACFFNVNFLDSNNKKKKCDVKFNVLVVVSVC